MKAGDISIDLSLDDTKFTVSCRNASQVLRTFRQSLDTAAEGVQRIDSRMDGFGSRLRNTVVLMGAARFAALDFYNVFLQLPAAILKTSGEMERLQKLMEGLNATTSNPAQAAKDSVKYITEMSLKAPFEIKKISDAFIKLKAGGIEPMNGSLKALIDSVAKFGGDSETLHRASIALQQMSGKGVISMEELRQQLGEAMPTAFAMMAKGVGTSIEELTKHVSKGEVGSKEALKRLFLQMDFENRGGAAKMMETWEGMTSQMATKWHLFQKDIGDAGFLDAMKSVAKEINAAFDSNAMKGFGKDVGSGLATTVIALKDFTLALKDNWEWVKTVGEGIGMYFGAKMVYSALGSMRGTLVDLNSAGRMRAASIQAEIALENERVTMKAAADAQIVSREIAHNETMIATRRAGNANLMVAANTMSAELIALKQRENGILVALEAERAGMGKGAALLSAGPTPQMTALTGQLRQLQPEIQRVENNLGMLSKAGVDNGTVMSNLLIRNRELAAAKTATANAAEMLANKVTMATRAMNVGSYIVGAMGGWLGVLTTALTLGAMAWSMWGNKGEEALKRVRDATNRGLADQATVDEAMRNRERAREDQKNTKSALSMVDPGPDGNLQREWLKKKLVAAEAAEGESNNMIIQATKQNTMSQARARADAQEQVFQSETAAIHNTSQKKVTELEKVKNAEIEAAGKNVEKVKAANKKFDLALRAERVKAYDDDLALAKSQLTKAEEDRANVGKGRGENSSSSEAADSVLNAARKRYNDAAAQRRLAKEMQDKDFEYGSGKDKKAKTPSLNANPLETKINAEQAEYEKLKQHFENIRNGQTGLEGLKAEVDAKWNSLIESGKFRYVDREKKKIVDAGGNEYMADDLKKIMSDTEGMKRASTLYESMRAKVTDSKEVADEARRSFAAGGIGLSSEVKSATKWLDDLEAKAGESGALEKLNEMLGTTAKSFSSLRAEIMKNVSVAGLANFTDGMADQAKKMSTDLIINDRERTQAQFNIELGLFDRKSALYIETARVNKVAEDEITQYTESQLALRRAMVAKNANDMKTPMEKMADNWRDVTGNLEKATASWAQGTVDAIVSMANTGKFAFGDLVKSILSDILKIQLQKSMASSMSGVMDFATKALGSYIGGGAGGMSSAGGGANMASVMANGYANGGIMSEFGNVALRKYANGGVAGANNPQLAIYGEGSMNEAFVPLPDGRSIPVSMNGGAPEVTINMINQSGTPMGAQQGNTRFDGKRMILDVVLEAASQPGPFRDTMKGAMK